MLVVLQAVGVATVPLKVTVLVPGVAPKFVPVMMTDAPTAPELGFKLAMLGGEIWLAPMEADDAHPYRTRAIVTTEMTFSNTSAHTPTFIFESP
jgi:hypothetical protein